MKSRHDNDDLKALFNALEKQKPKKRGREKIHEGDTQRAAAYIAKIESLGGRRLNLVLSPESVAAIDLIKATTGERHDKTVICRVLVSEADRISRKKS